MNTVSLKIDPTAITVNFTAPRADAQPQHMVIGYDATQSIGDNLEQIRVRLVGIDFAAIILENPLMYPFSDTVVGINLQRIDIGLALANMFNVPVVALPTVKKVGLKQALADKRDYLSWHLDYYGQYQAKRNYGQEAMLTIGNGFYGLRGAYVEASADEDNYPGWYAAGVYNDNTTSINGRDVVNEDLVNLPNAQSMTFGIDHAAPFRVRRQDIRDVYRSLDLKTGALTTTMMITLGTGHQLLVKTTKVADMTNWHRLVIRYVLTPLNFSGTLQVYANIDGNVINDNVARYAQFDQHHFTVTGMASAADKGLLTGATRNSAINFAIGSKLMVSMADITPVATTTAAKSLQQRVDFDVDPGKTYTVDKAVTLFTSRESPNQPLDTLVWNELDQTDFSTTAAHTKKFYQQVWATDDVQVEGDITSQKLLRVNIYHLFVAGAALASGQLDASVGARGLHGEAYRGHVFWDEMFVMPVYATMAPAIAKNMLRYRFKRLPAAQANAKAVGAVGAMYPWQSGLRGDEQAQSLHLNPLTNQWDPDNSQLQRHVSLAVAYDIWRYVQISGDTTYLREEGLAMLVAIAQFWASKATYDPQTKRYHIKGVMGPDEFHEGYPNSDESGLTDNAYTNLMVAWLFKLIGRLQTGDTATFASGLRTANVTVKEVAKWREIGQHLTLDINDAGIIGQFAGYFKLPKLDFDAYHKKYGDISRLDRILKAEGKTPDAYQVAKQADTLMAFFLLDKSELDTLISDMGYHLPTDYFAQNLQYYLDRTTHGSTLSRIVYAFLTRHANRRDQSWQLYQQALFSDYYDIQGGTTAEGIHLGVMGATIDVATRLYGGADTLGDQLRLAPQLPAQWSSLSYQLRFHGARIKVKTDHQQVQVRADKPLTVVVGAQTITLKPDHTETIDYRKEDDHDNIQAD